MCVYIYIYIYIHIYIQYVYIAGASVQSSPGQSTTSASVGRLASIKLQTSDRVESL